MRRYLGGFSTWKIVIDSKHRRYLRHHHINDMQIHVAIASWLVVVATLVMTALVIYQYLASDKDKKDKDKDNVQANGLCMFDVDGTLTRATDATGAVRACLENGYAVGINTAGGYMDADDIRARYNWMPDNMYAAMKASAGQTFVSILHGTVAGEPFAFPGGTEGTKKAQGNDAVYANMNIKGPLVMFDDNKNILADIETYDRTTPATYQRKAVCANPDSCANGKWLSYDTVKKALIG